jgi:hypothetical protein
MRDGWHNSLSHGKCTKWISRAKNQARAMLASAAHTQDESGAVVEDCIPQHVNLLGECFDWKENLSSSAIDATN